MSLSNNNEHLFAFYFKDVSDFVSKLDIGSEFSISDKDLVHRILKIIRLQENDLFVVFDTFLNITLCINKRTYQTKDKIFCKILKIYKNISLEPQVIFCPCLLKKNDFEEVIYAALQMGASEVLPILSDKVQKNWWSEREQERLFKIMIAAAEQSKNFVFPILHEPICLQKFLDNLKVQKGILKKIFFDVEGKPLIELLNQINQNNFEKIFILVGPEGDLVKKEVETLKENDFEFYALTPTILKSVQAAILGLGCVRSVVVR